jgi:uncharacterized protein YcfL
MKKVVTYVLIMLMLIGVSSCVTLASESAGTAQNDKASILSETTTDNSNLELNTLNDPNLLGHHGPGGPGGHGGHHRHRDRYSDESYGPEDNLLLLFAALAVVVLVGCSSSSDY